LDACSVFGFCVSRPKKQGVSCSYCYGFGALCGVHAKACVRKYGGKPMRTEYCHELAVRLLAGYMAATAQNKTCGVRFR